MLRFMRVGRVGAILILAFLYLALSTRCSAQTQNLRPKTQDAGQKDGSINRGSQTRFWVGKSGFGEAKGRQLSGYASESDDGVSDGGMLDAGIRMTVSLLMVLALIATGVFILKKVSPYRGLAADSANPVSVISRVPLGQKKSICLVRVADEILVIGMTSASVSLLTKMSAEQYYRGDGQTNYQTVKQKDKKGFGWRSRRLAKPKGDRFLGGEVGVCEAKGDSGFRKIYSMLLHRKEESIAKDRVSANINTINS